MRLGRLSGALPLVLMTLLIVAVGAFATVRQDAFLTSFNLNNLLLLTMPLALVSLGQTCASATPNAGGSAVTRSVTVSARKSPPTENAFTVASGPSTSSSTSRIWA